MSKSFIRKFLKKSEKGKDFLDNLTLKRSDIIFTSFPKTGRTWFRVLLMRYYQLYYDLPLDPTNFNFITLHPNAPKIFFTHDFISPIWCTIQELSKEKKRFYGKKIVLLFRDPKDTMVSAYFQKTKRASEDKNPSFNGTISEYIHSDIGGLETFLHFYKYWFDEKKNFDDFYLLNYNDFHKNQHKEFQKLLCFLGIGLDEIKISQTIEFSSFDNMHKMEKSNEFKVDLLKPVDVNDSNSFKTRKGKVGGYVDYLTQEDIDFIDKKTEEILGSFNLNGTTKNR